MSEGNSPRVDTRFKKGVSGNSKGRPKRQPAEVGRVMKGFIDDYVPYREGGRTRKATRQELSVRRHLKRALEGDIGAAEALLKLRATAQRKRATSGAIVSFTDLLPDAVTQSTPLVAGTRTVDETEVPTPAKFSDKEPASGA